MADDEARRVGGMSTEEKQVLLLRRQWELIEVLKGYRIRVPIIAGSLLLSLTAFVLNSKQLPADNLQKAAIVCLIALITTVSLMLFKEIHSQYLLRSHRISYLYEKLGMDSDLFGERVRAPEETAPTLFRLIFVAILLVGLICVAGIAMAPLASV